MFVFVGNKLIRKDNLYSLNIITKTIKKIIPEILKAKQLTMTTFQRNLKCRNNNYNTFFIPYYYVVIRTIF
jgi:hypothetical protein